MPHTLRTVLIGVDLASPSLAGAEWTARSFVPDARIVLAHVIEQHGLQRVLGEAQVDAVSTTLRTEATARLEELRQRLGPDRTETVVLEGAAGAGLTELAAERGVDLIVIGGHRESVAGGLLGNVASALLGHATVPVLVAHAMPAGPPARLLVAVDTSDAHGPVLAWARTLADTFGMTGQVVSAVQPPGVPISTTLFSSEDEYLRTRALVVERTQEWTRRAADESGLDPERFSAAASYGRPEVEITLAAERIGADLIIIGTRGRTHGHALILGSVARRVVEASNCPVLVVPPARPN